jgi:2-amino-4-hydroxy-6-hydroxymethyldihydropteridine diphosphokinase
LGSNIDPSNNIIKAINELQNIFDVTDVSKIWESCPVGSHGPIFLNGVVAIRTTYSYGDLKNRLRKIEQKMGRIRTEDKNAPRTIDLDILIYDGDVLDADIWTQTYLAVPLADVIPSLVNPINGETIKDTSERLKKVNVIFTREDIFDGD